MYTLLETDDGITVYTRSCILSNLWIYHTMCHIDKLMNTQDYAYADKMMRVQLNLLMINLRGFFFVHKYKDLVTNKEVCAKIQQVNWPHEDLLIIIKSHKLQCYGHVSCSSGLAKIILQGTVKGGRRQGRERKRWEDSIREWTGLEFAKSQSSVENREKWRKLVVKSSVVPQWPWWLRDRWWW